MSEISTLHLALPEWIVHTVELSENAERAAKLVNPETSTTSRKLIVELSIGKSFS